ncbi:MAG: hypothetical protein ACYTXY_14880 [Nostoc sp.]
MSLAWGSSHFRNTPSKTTMINVALTASRQFKDDIPTIATTPANAMSKII